MYWQHECHFKVHASTCSDNTTVISKYMRVHVLTTRLPFQSTCEYMYWQVTTRLPSQSTCGLWRSDSSNRQLGSREIPWGGSTLRHVHPETRRTCWSSVFSLFVLLLEFSFLNVCTSVKIQFNLWLYFCSSSVSFVFSYFCLISVSSVFLLLLELVQFPLVCTSVGVQFPPCLSFCWSSASSSKKILTCWCCLLLVCTVYSTVCVCVASRIARDGAGASFLQEGESGNSMGLDWIHTHESTTHYLK